ncbi:hybrid signal transduction histidine kinase dhkK [Acrasis kona]|uniref:histidine kinase n=1 Tax=Acrasis kona TaxID=1008807 RepID=A0AAW2ZSD4_9EUKA
MTGYAQQDNNPLFRDDPYLMDNLCKSLLCIPIFLQGDLKGVLYMTNDLYNDCFNPERVLLLKLLASQLATSIQYNKHFTKEMQTMAQMHKMEQQAEIQKKRMEDQVMYRKNQEEFIDRVCHEIRNPIQGIIGNCQALKDIITSLQVNPVHSTAMQSCIQSIEECGMYQKVVTDDVLTLSKLELNKVTLNLSHTNIHNMVNTIYRMNVVEAERKGIVLDCSFINVPKNSSVLIDGNRVSMVIVNFVTNAIKFTSNGKVSIICSIKSSSTGPEKLEFIVKDTGIGMTASEMKRLFNRFSQATQRISAEYGGSGLGLFISKAIADLMNGSITVNSDKGIGTEFKFEFEVKSLNEGTDVCEDKVQAVEPKWRRSTAHDQPIQVLVAEDNKINQRVIERMLKGCKVVMANDGAEAVNYFQTRGPFDLVLMDIAMPNLDGYQATKAIRKIEGEKGQQHTLIVGLSGNVRQEYHDLGRESGMDLFYNKPIMPSQVKSLIEMLV